MAETTTPNYGLLKPDIAGSAETWGVSLNTDLDTLDTHLKLTQTAADNSMQRSSTDVLKRTATELLFYDTTKVTNPKDSTVGALMSNGAVRELLNIMLPIGTIILWSGDANNIPWGWAMCNGQPSNGNQTPNLSDRFVMQAGGIWPPHYTGGVTAFGVSTRTAEHVLTPNQMPYHTHDLWETYGAHLHNTSFYRTKTGYGLQQGGGLEYATQLLATVDKVGSAAYNVSETHVYMTAGGAGANWGHAHDFGFSINWPDYYPRFYVLCYIMRVIPF